MLRTPTAAVLRAATRADAEAVSRPQTGEESLLYDVFFEAEATDI